MAGLKNNRQESTMSKLALFILVLVSSKLVFVASQACTESKDCKEDGSCCHDGLCTTDRITCLLDDKKRKILCCISGTCEEYDCSSQKKDITCYTDWQCQDGCCVESTCQPKSNWQCNKNSCTENWECDGGCCKDNKCQDTYWTCSRTDYYTTAAPDLSNSCHYDCSDYGECCVEGECQSCYQYTTLPWPTIRGYTYDNDNHDDGYYGSSDSSSSDLGVGPSIGIAVAVIFLVILKLALWRHCYTRRERVIVVRRRITCIRVPIVENDELQREHERAEQEIPARLPPAYSPRPFQGNTENPPVGPPPVYSPTPTTKPNETTESAQTQNAGDNTEDVHGVPQGHTMVPPPAYSPNHVANADQSVNSAQTYQTQGMTGNAEQMNGVPQGSLRVPPSTYPASPSANTSQNATEQNTQGNTIGPFLI